MLRHRHGHRVGPLLLLAVFGAAVSLPAVGATPPPVASTATASVGDIDGLSSRIANGGGVASGGGYSLRSTIGQAEASDRVTGTLFSATLGFRRESGALAEDLFADGFEPP